MCFCLYAKLYVYDEISFLEEFEDQIIKEEGQLKEQKKKLFEQYFCNSGKSQKAAIEEAMRNSKLCLLDITAGCDCAQNKEGFHKAVITYLVPKLPTLKLRDKKTRPAIPDSVNVKNISLNKLIAESQNPHNTKACTNLNRCTVVPAESKIN